MAARTLNRVLTNSIQIAREIFFGEKTLNVFHIFSIIIIIIVVVIIFKSPSLLYCSYRNDAAASLDSGARDET